MNFNGKVTKPMSAFDRCILLVDAIEEPQIMTKARLGRAHASPSMMIISEGLFSETEIRVSSIVCCLFLVHITTETVDKG